MRVVSVGMCGVYVSMGVGVRWVWRAWCVCMKRVEFMHVAVFQIHLLLCSGEAKPPGLGMRV